MSNSVIEVVVPKGKLAEWNISRKGDINQSDLRTRKCYCENNKLGRDILFGCDRFTSSPIGR